MSHTPGPWKLCDDDKNNGTRHIENSEGYTVVDLGFTIRANESRPYRHGGKKA